jgi:hypothetical protein
MKRTPLLPLAALAWALSSCAVSQNAFIVVIDGARYTETFAKKDTNMPRLWNDLRPQGTVFTNFRNEGHTVTCPGHAAFLTGEYEDLENDGSERPRHPTLFEYFRAKKRLPEHSCYAVTGKPKLDMLTYSTDGDFGKKFGAKSASPAHMSDTATWRLLRDVMDAEHPRLVIVNFPSVDAAGHDSDWTGYLGSIRTADSLVHLLWNAIQSDPFYRDRTTMFVSSDHGRHDDAHGGFQHHGCPCEGCRHIIGFGIGPGFLKGAEVRENAEQVDVRAALAQLLAIPVPGGGRNRILTDAP